jgi:excisionase family DNA binding protein
MQTTERRIVNDRLHQQKPQQLLTPDEVAVLLGVPRLFVIRQSRAGKIPCVKIGKVYRYRASSIEAWIVEQEGQA